MIETFLKPEIWVLLAIGALLLVAGWLLYQLGLRTRATASPSLQGVLDALVPYAYQGIFAGERMVVSVLDEAEAYIAAADKKAVADSIYDLLPPVITLGKYTISTDLVKRLVPREEFQRLVENVYNTADAFFQRNEQYLKDQVASLPPLPANPTTKTATVGRSIYGVDGAAYSEIKDFSDANPVPEPKG
jgi:hypothetical protein